MRKMSRTSARTGTGPVPVFRNALTAIVLIASLLPLAPATAAAPPADPAPPVESVATEEPTEVLAPPGRTGL